MNPVMWCEYPKIMNTTKNVLFDPLLVWFPILRKGFRHWEVANKISFNTRTFTLNFSSMFHWKMYCLQKLKTRFLHFDHICPFLFGGESYLQLDGFCSGFTSGISPSSKMFQKILVLIIIIHPFCVWGLYRGNSPTRFDFDLKTRPKLVSKKILVVTNTVLGGFFLRFQGKFDEMNISIEIASSIS